VARRVGCFSYGSGCCSEFYSGVIAPAGQRRQRALGIAAALDARHRLSIDEYEEVLRTSGVVRFGTRAATLDARPTDAAPVAAQRLLLREIRDFHRQYEWVA
jgi:polyketide biosynthesis 3-hydroxy-3-methylglutaryl-CoA synthase-like enzyme PksG